MVLALAADSVEMKLQMQASVLVGNYEFYYAAGKLAQYVKLSADEHAAPLEMKAALEAALAQFKPAEDDAKCRYLVLLLERYRPSEKKDEQMEQLFLWGKTGERINEASTS